MSDIWSREARENGLLVKRNGKVLAVCPTNAEASQIVDAFQMLERIAVAQEKAEVVIDTMTLHQDDVRAVAVRLGWV